MNKRMIKLTKREITFLQEYKSSKDWSLREFNRANILLLLHDGKKESEIADFLDIERTTIWRTKQKYLKSGIEKSLKENVRSGQPSKYSDHQKAEVIATACSKAPEGRSRWTLRLLTTKLKQQKGMSGINRETIRLILKKTNANLG